VTTKPKTPVPRARRVLLYVLALFVFVELVITVLCGVLFDQGFSVGSSRYVPYVDHIIERREPGTRDGFRVTVGAESDYPAIWMFGGSTVEGGYHEDPDHPCEPGAACTLPSHLYEVLREGGRPHTVHNLGQGGYHSNQERILFQELLGRQKPPQIAIFYDGVNDTENGARIAGYPSDYERIRDILERRRNRTSFGYELAASRVKSLFLLNSLLNSRWGSRSLDDFNPYGAIGKSDEAYLYAIAENYVHNVRLIEATCREFEIECYYFWQPVVYYKKHKTSRELAHKLYEGPDKYREVRKNVRSLMPRTGVRGFYDISDLFDDTSAHLFWDYCHIDEASPGHRVIAEAMRDYILADQGPR
jgi:hypothetical protein